MFKSYAVGNLTADARLADIGGKQACQFSIGVRTSHKDKESNTYLTNFVSVIVFGYQAEFCSRLKKGDKVAVSGDISATPYMTRDSRPGVNINLRADSVEAMSKPQGNTNEGRATRPTPPPQNNEDWDDQLPF